MNKYWFRFVNVLFNFYFRVYFIFFLKKENVIFNSNIIVKLV